MLSKKITLSFDYKIVAPTLPLWLTPKTFLYTKITIIYYFCGFLKFSKNIFPNITRVLCSIASALVFPCCSFSKDSACFNIDLYINCCSNHDTNKQQIIKTHSVKAGSKVWVESMYIVTNGNLQK